MKNLFLVTLLLTISTNLLFAQAETVEYSAPFDEPEDGWRKVLQLSNGNTFFLNYAGKGGIDVKVYGPDRKLKSQKNIDGREWEPKEFKTSKISGLYEIGGAPVIFIQQVLKREPKLFRLTLDAQTGALAEEKLIGTLQKHHAGMAFAMVWGGIQEPVFHVEKSPEADNYAVINFNSISPESDERINVKLYTVKDGKHTELSNANYESQGYKYVNYVSSYVSKDALYLCAYGYNTKKSGGEDSRMIISKLEKGSNEFTHKKIEFSDDFEDTRGIMTYNPGSGMLQMLTLTYLKKESNVWSGKNTTTYLPLMTYIDPKSLQIVKATPLTIEYAQKRVEETFEEKRPYSGMPQYMVVNKDNSTSVIVEQIFKTQQTSYGQTRTISTSLGHIGIAELDMKGNETVGYAAKKAQKASADMSVFNLTDRVRGRWSYVQPGSFIMGDNTPFFSFNYVNTDNGKYLIFNDFPENFDKDGAKKINEVDAASNMHTVYYELENGFFKKHYLYGTPGKDQLKFTNIQSANVKGNTYATLMVERDGRKKQAHIAWVKFK